MHIKPTDKTIREILKCGSSFSIPMYQREYSWERRNYQEFLEDMVNSLEINDGNIIPSEYFMGTMLFVGELGESKKEVYVVDGQQRLTTITILFSALSDHFIEESENAYSEKIFEYILHETDDKETKPTLITKTNYPYFAEFIQDREKRIKVQAESEEEQCIFDSYVYLYKQTSENSFRKQLYKKFDKKVVDSISYIDLLKALRDQVLQTIVVSISTLDRTHANKIFEILNAKGKHLATIDLIKNRIFEELEKAKLSDFAETTWDDIKKTLYKDESEIGFATFYSHYWVSKYKKSYSNKLYDDFISDDYLPQNENSYKDFLEGMKKEVKWYVQITSPIREYWGNKKTYYRVVQALSHISKDFSIVQSRIALLALFDAKDKGLIKQGKFKEVIDKMEKFHYVYNAICSKRASNLETVYSKFAINIRKSKDSNEANKHIESLYSDWNGLFPSFEEFEQRFIKLTYSKTPHPDNVKARYAVYMLYGLEEDTVDYLYPDNGSIEHILPESKGDKSLNREDDISLNIGNLIALEESINKECDNLCYHDKRNYYKKSKYNCVLSFVKDHRSWSEMSINDRAKNMARTMYYDFLTK